MTTIKCAPLALLAAIVSCTLAACGGGPEPVAAPPQAATVRGANVFYLARGDEDMPYILENIDAPSVRGSLDRILTGLKAAHVNSIRLLIAADHFPLTKRRNAWPVPDAWQTEGLRKLVDVIAGKGFSVYLVFVGKTVDEKNQLFISAEKDLIWINSFLSAVDRAAVVRVDLSGDAFVCDDTGCEQTEGQKNHADYLRAVWRGRPASWPVSYESGGPSEYTTPRGVRNGIRWALEQTPGAPVSIGFYPPAERVREYAEVIAEFKVPIWISEYGGSVEFYRAFLKVKCEQKWAAYAWTAGVGWYGYGLWNPTLDDPTPQLAALAQQYGECQ